MTTTYRGRLLAAAAITSAIALPAYGQELTQPDPDDDAGVVNNGVGFGVSADGSVILGEVRVDAAGNTKAVYWTPDDGFVELGDLGRGDGGGAARDASADGSVITGTSFDADGASRSFVWTEAGGMVNLGVLNEGRSTAARAISDDGTVIVGGAYDGDASQNRAFRWTEAGGLESLGTLDGGASSFAYGISGDGTVIVGDSRSATSGIYHEAMMWTEAGGMVELGKLDNSDRSRATGASTDGSVIAGYAATQSMGTRAFRWTSDTGMVDLGVLNGGGGSTANDISGDGLVVVGTAADGAEDDTARAFRWTEAGGMVTVEDWLRGEGATIAENVTRMANATNCDGSVVTGETFDGLMFIARAASSDSCAAGAGAGGGDSGGDDGEGGDNTGGGESGLITVDDLQASLGGAASSNISTVTAMGTALNGAGSRPLDRRAARGRGLAWIGGDWGNDDHGARDGDFLMGEVGAGGNFGGVQLNAAVGLAEMDQETLLGGASETDATYLKGEAMLPLGATADGGLWAVLTGVGLWGESDITRAYMANGGVVAFSSGTSDVEGYGLRGRLAWENAAPGLTPYGEISWSETCLDAYTETGGAFPAAFNELCADVTEARIGADATVPVGGAFAVIATLEGVHRFEDSGPAVSGQVTGLSAFSFAGRAYEQDWLRGGLGFQVGAGGTVLSVMANATTEGETADVWLAAALRAQF